MRTKEFTPSLGELLSLLAVSNSVTWGNIKHEFTQEQLERDIFWKLNSDPELIKKKPEDIKIDEEFIEKFFKPGVSQYIVMFYVQWLQNWAKPDGEKLEDTALKYDQIIWRQQNTIHSNLMHLTRQVKSIRQMKLVFINLGLEIPTKQELSQAINIAITNSKRKKYHGTDDEVFTIPKTQEQIKEYQQKFPDFMSAVSQSTSDKEWKDLCFSRWKWMRELEFQMHNQQLQPQMASYVSNQIIQMNQSKIVRKEFLKQIIADKFQREDSEKLQQGPIDINSTFEKWIQIYAKLDFEEFLFRFHQNPDFANLYKYLGVAPNYLESVNIPILPTGTIKSNFYYIVLVLNAFETKKLKAVKFIQVQKAQFSKKTLCYIFKGFEKLNSANNNQIEMIDLSNTFLFAQMTDQETIDLFYKTIISNANLKSLILQGNTGAQCEVGKCIGKVLFNHKKLMHLDISKCQLLPKVTKLIADGLVKAKVLEEINISENSMEDSGLTAILYNLSFSTRIKVITAEQIDCSKNKNLQDLQHAATKLLTSAFTLEYLSFKQSAGISNVFTDEVFQALSQNQNLYYLNIAQTGNLQAKQLGQSVAFNSWFEGKLQVLDLGKSFESSKFLDQFCQGLWVSNQDKEKIFGDRLKANEMVGHDVVKHFRCNLRQIPLINYATKDQMMAKTHKHKPNEYIEPQLVSFISQSQELQFLDLQSSKLMKIEIDFLSKQLNSRLNQNISSNLIIINLKQNHIGSTGTKLLFNNLMENQIIQNIDLSGNQIGVSGVVAICEVLKSNKSIQYLSLFSNKVSFDGAKSFGKALEVNRTLKFLDLGCNRIRNKGAVQLTKGIMNSNSNFEELALNWNFITDDGLYRILENLLQFRTLKKLFIKNNQISNKMTKATQAMLEQNQYNLYVDILGKLEYMENTQLEKSVWICPAHNFTKDQIIHFFENTHRIGTVIDCRIRQGGKIKSKKFPNVYAFVEFGHVNSVTRALHLAAQKKSVLNGKKFKIFRTSSKGINDKLTAQSTLFGERNEQNEIF